MLLPFLVMIFPGTRYYHGPGPMDFFYVVIGIIILFLGLIIRFGFG